MSICPSCEREMLAADGCVNIPVSISGVEYQRILYGDEKYGEIRNPERCHDCAAKLGNFHHVNCDWEQCPKCGGQLIGCDCDIN